VAQRQYFIVKKVSFAGGDYENPLSVTFQDILSMFQYSRPMKIVVSMVMFCMAEPEFSDSLRYRALGQVN
jgi:hypothetical protein